MNIEISSICNLQCSFCPELIRSKKLMDIHLFEKAIQQVAPLTELVCFHLMGDPLVHPNLDQFVKICEKYQTKIFFVTNGVLLNEKQVQILNSPAFYQINFSLHSFHDNFGEKDPTTYLEKIFRFTENRLIEQPQLYINYRLWNLQDVKGAGTQNQEMLRRIEERFQNKIRTDIDVRRQKSIPIQGRLYLHFDTEFTWPSMDLPLLGQQGTCYGLSSHFGIHADGTVVPCCLDKEADIPLGNLQTDSLESILNSVKAQAILTGFRNRKLISDLCQRCQYVERFQ